MLPPQYTQQPKNFKNMGLWVWRCPEALNPNRRPRQVEIPSEIGFAAPWKVQNIILQRPRKPIKLLASLVFRRPLLDSCNTAFGAKQPFAPANYRLALRKARHRNLTLPKSLAQTKAKSDDPQQSYTLM